MSGVLSRIENVKHIAKLSSAPHVHRDNREWVEFQSRSMRLPSDTEPEPVEFVSVDWQAHSNLVARARGQGSQVGITCYTVELDGVRQALWKAFAREKMTEKRISDESLAALMIKLEREIPAEKGKGRDDAVTQSNYGQRKFTIARR